MPRFAFTFQYQHQHAVISASGANETCALAEAMGELWQLCGDAWLDGAKVVGVRPVLPKFTCVYCGHAYDATEADIADAHATAVEAEGSRAIALSDADATRDYGRDVCDRCSPRFKAEQLAARERRARL